jgi:hypothetical protein
VYAAVVHRLALLFFVLLAGCGPSAEEIQAEFEDHLAANDSCTADTDCTVISPGCPLGCFVAVRADRADACEARARELIDDYESGGESCDYDCAAPGPVRCEAEHCTVDAL